MLVGAQAAEGLGLWDDASVIYRQLLRLGQEAGQSRRALARLALRKRDLAGASRELEPLLQSGGQDTADVTMAAEIARLAGRADEAARWTARLQRLQTEQTARGYHDKGLAAANQGNPQAAITWYQAALAVNETPQVRAALGKAYYDLGRYADAESQQRRAIAIGPGFGPGWYGLAETLAARGDRPGATAAFRRYMEVEPAGYWSAKAKQAIDRLERR
jgi:tetratricopeptide (TPR) repeat protein